MTRARLWPWLVRGSWALVALAAGPGYAALLDERSPPVQAVASLGLWLAWAVVVVATLVPLPVSLTALRCAVPAGAGLSVWAAAAGHGPAAAGLWWIAAIAAAFAPATGAMFVNGPAYPNERRFPLRPPGPLLLGPLEVTWALALGGPAVGALLLAAERWVLGAAVSVVAVPLSFVLLRAIHGLSRRWLVFVPTGVVLHDPITLLDPVLFPRPTVGSLGPAPAGTDATDLTQRAWGLALELRLKEEVPAVLSRPGRRQGETVRLSALLFTPTRPGAVLEEARSRSLT